MKRHRWPPEGGPADQLNICIVCGVKRRFQYAQVDPRFRDAPGVLAPIVVEYLVPGHGWSVQRPPCETPGQLELLTPDPREGILP